MFVAGARAFSAFSLRCPFLATLPPHHLLFVHVVQEDLLELEALLSVEALDLVATINSS